uniref:Uncharacterized protein n=1 Tax=Ananas comosus var. bracteatus TaxID=296719 RepID=A0A6V7NF54_ANACO|nr:unnamed protein product [Ananas comosus var. bracteatus]
MGPSKNHSVHCPVWAALALRDRSPRHLGPVSQFVRKTSVGEPVSPRQGLVSRTLLAKHALGNRSLPARDRLPQACRSTTLRGPVSPIRDRFPRVKILRTKSKL